MGFLETRDGVGLKRNKYSIVPPNPDSFVWRRSAQEAPKGPSCDRPFRARGQVIAGNGTSYRPSGAANRTLRFPRGLDLSARIGEIVGMTAIPLCVPFALKDEARRAGARWDRDQRVWTCEPGLLRSNAYEGLRPFVPRMYRPELRPPYIRPWMVPQTLWGRNLRALLSKEEWDVVRRHAYEAAGNRCRVCGGRGPQWPVEADEAWDYDDETRTQTLKGVIALCPDCHHVRHWGRMTIEGREEEVIAWAMRINRWTRAAAEDAAAFAFDQWDRRSRHEWSSDYSWVTRVHGFRPDEHGERRAEAANRDLVEKAAARADAVERGAGMSGFPDEGDYRASSDDPTIRMRPITRSSIPGLLKSLFGE